MDELICIRSTKCLRLKNTSAKKGITYFYNKSRIKSNGEIYLYYKPNNFNNPSWGYLGIYHIKDFMNEKEYDLYKKRMDKINEILNGFI
jgi:hypothetical protein